MMLHPASVHFAIVLPVVASVLSVAYLLTKTESMSKSKIKKWRCKC